MIGYYNVVDGQGWNESTQLQLVLDFVARAGQTEALVEYLKHRAAEENDQPLETDCED